MVDSSSRLWQLKPLGCLSLLLGCSTVTGYALDVSWMAGVPMLFLLGGLCASAGIYIAKSGIITQNSSSVFCAAAPLTLLGLCSIVFCLINFLTWSFLLPSSLLTLGSSVMTTLTVQRVQMNFKVRAKDPLVSLSLLVGSSVLTGVTLELSWIAGGLMMIELCGVVLWSFVCVHRWHKEQIKQGKACPAKALIAMAAMVVSCGVASTITSIFLPFGFITLDVVMIASSPVLCLLVAYQWAEISKHIYTVVAVTSLLTLIGVVSTGLLFNVTWTTLIPNGLLLTYSTVLLNIGLYQTKMIKNSPFYSCLCLMMFPTFGTVSIAFYFLSPQFFALSFVSTICAFPFILYTDYRDSMAFVVLTFFLYAYGLATVVCTFCLEEAFTALITIVVIASLVHVMLFYVHWEEIRYHPLSVVFLSALLTVQGVLSSGLFYTLQPLATYPSALLLVYSMIILSVGLHESNLIKRNLTAIIFLVILLVSAASTAISFYLAPVWFPIASLATLVTVPFLIYADVQTEKPHILSGCYTAVLQLVVAAAIGVAIVDDLPVGWSLFLAVALLFSILLWGLLRVMIEEAYVNAPAVKHSTLLIGALVIDVALIVSLTIAFHFAHKAFPALIPLILVGNVTLCCVAVCIIFCFRKYTAYIGLAGAFLSLLTLYFLVVSCTLAGKPGARLPHYEEHQIGFLTSFSLAYHCVLVTFARLIAEDSQKSTARTAAAAGLQPAAAVAAVAPPPAAVVVQADVDSDYESVAKVVPIAMNASVNLSALPDDIKKYITRMIKRHDDCINLRLISPAWNMVVVHHLDATRKLIPLERVYLHSGNIGEVDYEKHGPRHDDNESKRVQIHVIIHDEYLEGVGVGKFLNIHEEFDNALELSCTPQKFRVWSATSALGALLMRKKKEERKFGLYKRFFSYCSHIDTLVMDHLKDKYLTVFDALISTLGVLKISKLIIKDFDIDENMQERIMKMARKHHIQHIAISCCKLDEHSFFEFIKTLVKLNIAVDIYEEKYNATKPGYFRLPFKFWSQLNSRLRKNGVSVEWTYAYDNPYFNKYVLHSEVMSYLKCRRANQVNEANFPVSVSRGFYRELPYLPYYL